MTLKSQKKVFPSGTTLDVAMLERCIFVWGHPTLYDAQTYFEP